MTKGKMPEHGKGRMRLTRQQIAELRGDQILQSILSSGTLAQARGNIGLGWAVAALKEANKPNPNMKVLRNAKTLLKGIIQSNKRKMDAARKYRLSAKRAGMGEEHFEKIKAILEHCELRPKLTINDLEGWLAKIEAAEKKPR
jgi:hypothetical protein